MVTGFSTGQSPVEYKIEPELLAPAPRRVRLHITWLKAGATVAVIAYFLFFMALWNGIIVGPSARPMPVWLDLSFNVLMAVAGLGFLGGIWTDFQLVRRGSPAMAMIYDKTEQAVKRGTAYTLLYAFECESGRRWTAEERIGRRAWKEIGVGDTLTVLYQREKPKNCRLYKFCPFRAVP